MAAKNHIENVAIVGGAGQVGSYFVEELLKTGKHRITAITRKGGNSKFPDKVHVAKVDYNDHDTLVQALTGQEFFIITMSNQAPQDSQLKLVDAAIEAGVPFIMPNWYGADLTNKKLVDEIFIGHPFENTTSRIASSGKSSWIALACGAWYEYSLCGSQWRYGFDLKNRAVTFYDDGETKTDASTFVQTGRAVAKLLSLKISPEGPDDEAPTLTQFRNSGVYVSSFHLSQKDMLESLKRVTGTSDGDWKITSRPSAELYTEGLEIMQGGNRDGFSLMLYARYMYPNGDGSFGAKLSNAVLGLPEEDLDEATKRGIEMYRELC